MVNKEMIEDMLQTNPLSLLAIHDMEVVDYLNNLIPYSSAFEIECDMGENYDVQNFESIPDIIDVHNDSYEQRYRIPNGLKGIICLYNICHQLKLNSLLNPLSSIHYHVDCTDCYPENVSELSSVVQKNVNWVLSELDTWLDGDSATSRSYGYWFKINTLNTLEFRLGEMTFEYKILLKRLIHVNSMVRKLKLDIGITRTHFTEPNKQLLLNYYSSQDHLSPTKNLDRRLNALLAEAEKQKTVETPKVTTNLDHAKATIKTRSHKLF